MTDTPSNLMRVLRKLGFSFYREGKRHTLMIRRGIILSIPRHSRDLTDGLFHKILKNAELTPSDYIRLR